MRQLVESRASDRHLGVLIGSDDPLTRQAFRSGARAPGIEILAEGTVTAVADQLAAAIEPDIVVLDVQIAAGRALRAIQKIRTGAPGTRILACAQPAGIEFGLLCLTTGAWGYISKEVDVVALPRLLRALASGEAVIPRALGTELVRRFVRPGATDRPRTDQLSAPECRLLELLRTGLTLQEAAKELAVTPSTARRHLGSVRRKLSVPSPASNSDPGSGGYR
jgi:DNA-binding NarL/FixJ family response regulator